RRARREGVVLRNVEPDPADLDRAAILVGLVDHLESGDLRALAPPDVPERRDQEPAAPVRITAHLLVGKGDVGAHREQRVRRQDDEDADHHRERELACQPHQMLIPKFTWNRPVTSSPSWGCSGKAYSNEMMPAPKMKRTPVPRPCLMR